MKIKPSSKISFKYRGRQILKLRAPKAMCAIEKRASVAQFRLPSLVRNDLIERTDNFVAEISRVSGLTDTELGAHSRKARRLDFP